MLISWLRWMHQPGKVTMGLQGTPIAVDGIIYYIASFNVVFAIDGIAVSKFGNILMSLLS